MPCKIRYRWRMHMQRQVGVNMHCQSNAAPLQQADTDAEVFTDLGKHTWRQRDCLLIAGSSLKVLQAANVMICNASSDDPSAMLPVMSHCDDLQYLQWWATVTIYNASRDESLWWSTMPPAMSHLQCLQWWSAKPPVMICNASSNEPSAMPPVMIWNASSGEPLWWSAMPPVMSHCDNLQCLQWWSAIPPVTSKQSTWYFCHFRSKHTASQFWPGDNQLCLRHGLVLQVIQLANLSLSIYIYIVLKFDCLNT